MRRQHMIPDQFILDELCGSFLLHPVFRQQAKQFFIPEHTVAKLLADQFDDTLPCQSH